MSSTSPAVTVSATRRRVRVSPEFDRWQRWGEAAAGHGVEIPSVVTSVPLEV